MQTQNASNAPVRTGNEIALLIAEASIPPMSDTQVRALAKKLGSMEGVEIVTITRDGDADSSKIGLTCNGKEFIIACEGKYLEVASLDDLNKYGAEAYRRVAKSADAYDYMTLGKNAGATLIPVEETAAVETPKGEKVSRAVAAQTAQIKAKSAKKVNSKFPKNGVVIEKASFDELLAAFKAHGGTYSGKNTPAGRLKLVAKMGGENIIGVLTEGKGEKAKVSPIYNEHGKPVEMPKGEPAKLGPLSDAITTVAAKKRAAKDGPQVGNRVTWIAGGKVARLEGMKGQEVSGVVTEINEGGITVDVDHRRHKDAKFHGMLASVGFDQILTCTAVKEPTKKVVAKPTAKKSGKKVVGPTPAALRQFAEKQKAEKKRLAKAKPRTGADNMKDMADMLGLEAAPVKKGDKVLAKWEDGEYYKGTVVNVFLAKPGKEGRAEIEWEDGDDNLKVRFSHIKPRKTAAKKPVKKAAKKVAAKPVKAKPATKGKAPVAKKASPKTASKAKVAAKKPVRKVAKKAKR